jgi:hypothetical protein
MPSSQIPDHDARHRIARRSERYGKIGCAVGGIAIPIALLVVASCFGDTGGPLLWPVLAVLLGGLGLLVGSIIGAAKR